VLGEDCLFGGGPVIITRAAHRQALTASSPSSRPSAKLVFGFGNPAMAYGRHPEIQDP
jgi:hypothetical protein